MNRKLIITQFLIAIGALLLFVPFLGQVHLFDWDELNFAESAREMILTKDYLTVRAFFQPFWEKPPLFIWIQVLSMKLFGINEFAARFPNAICGVVTLLVIFNIGRKLYNENFGLIWVMAYAGSLLPFFYFKSGIIDPWFNLFIFLGIYFWVEILTNKNIVKEMLNAFFSALFLGLAVLTKGPAAIVIFGLTAGVLFILQKFRLNINWKSLLVFVFSLIFIGGFWFILQILSGNYDLMVDFIVYQIRLVQTEDAGHGGFPFYHFVVLLIGVFPASVFAIQGHRFKGLKDEKWLFHLSMIVVLWVVLILFSIIRTKIVHYSSMCYFPLTYLATYGVYLILEGKSEFKKWQKIMIGSIGFLLALIVMLLPVFNHYKLWLVSEGYITDLFTASNLKADPGWTAPYSLIGLVLLIGLGYSLFVKNIKSEIRLKILALSSLIFIALTIYFVVPGAEKISQNASIEFLKEKSKEDAYVFSFFKSYAPPFYSNQQVPVNSLVNNREWLINGEVDKKVYGIARIKQKEEILKSYPEFEFLYEKNGYLFFVRYPSALN